MRTAPRRVWNKHPGEAAEVVTIITQQFRRYLVVSSLREHFDTHTHPEKSGGAKGAAPCCGAAKDT